MTSNSEKTSECDSEGRHYGPRPVEPRRHWYVRMKLVLDFLLACVFSVIALPIVAVVGVLVKLTSPGPVFYTQTRLGKHGKPFKIVKIRTMKHNAEKLTGPKWASVDDPRITPLGRILRDSHIDELPQLFNVLRGDMSLVGPRPERPEFVVRLAEEIPHYCLRMEVSPGVTGLAQVHLPADTDLESVRKKLTHDLYYVRNLSPWLDGLIILATGWQLMVSLWNVALRPFRLPSSAAVEMAVEHYFEQQREALQTEHISEEPPAMASPGRSAVLDAHPEGVAT